MDAGSQALVLVVDDDPFSAGIITEALMDLPVAVDVATDGEAALARTRDEKPDLILLDALMPGMSGFEVCQLLKADPETRDIPIIFMTALGDPSDRVRGLEIGAVDYVIKPFRREELLARVKTQLALRAAVRALSERNAELVRAQEELERGRQELELEVLRRTEELRVAKERLEIELSTPIIRLGDRVLVMPLVGSIDQQRAARVLEAALARASEVGAETMILDITGVPRADASAAEAILRTARALRLLGARTVLTGVSPEVARTLVGLDVDFTGIVTQTTLQGGIAYALGRSSAG